MQNLLPATDDAISMPKVQHAPSGPLAPSGLSDEWSKGYNSYFSHVKLGPQEKIGQFYVHINNAMTNPPLSSLVKSGDIILHIVAVTFGSADVMIVWQAKDDNAAKEFRDHLLAGNPYGSETLCALSGDGHDG